MTDAVAISNREFFFLPDGRVTFIYLLNVRVFATGSIPFLDIHHDGLLVMFRGGSGRKDRQRVSVTSRIKYYFYFCRRTITDFPGANRPFRIAKPRS